PSRHTDMGKASDTDEHDEAVEQVNKQMGYAWSWRELPKAVVRALREMFRIGKEIRLDDE
ncbi:MAG: hypothetical protein ACOCV2_15630, partial [Persicimonas sp.]